MNLQVLSLNECLSLCRGAAVLVMHRFRWLGQQVTPEDRPLALLFADLAGDVEKILVEIWKLEGVDRPPEVLEKESGQQVARGFLPSLLKTVGDGPLDRESGLYLAECLLEDFADFFGALVRQAEDEQARDLLQRSQQAVSTRLGLLRHVLL